MGRRSKAVKLVGGVRGGLALLDDDERRRVIEAGERDIDDGVGFFSRHGSARHGSARPRGTRVRGGGAEPAAPVLGLQDTGTDRNRVLREPSGASRPTIRAEQKTGHINVPDGTFAPPLVRLCGSVVSACRRTAPGRSRRRTRGSQPDARPSATASGRSSPG